MADGNETLLGRVAVAAKLISLDQLNEAVREYGKAGSSKNLGETLVELGFLTAQKLDQVVKLQQQVLAKAKTGMEAKRPSAAPAQEKEPAAEPASEPEAAAAAKPARAPARKPAATTGDSGAIDALLRDAVEAGASDIHVHSGVPIRFRLRGKMYDHGSEPIDTAQAEALLLPTLSDQDRQRFEEHGELDYCYALEGVGRYRANI